MIINVWRNVCEEPINAWPLAVCDASTVKQEDYIVGELRHPFETVELYSLNHEAAHRHRWYYYPQMLKSEALLFKNYDSKGDQA